ncbi:olfactory receptor 14J1-like, partial [Apteryx mantelli]|uniref:Olfactory receptor 14J1-like n=1 Tax=Apteryx mantelli TaxID=2696672 RepID=A0ABM4F2K7_9AVES
LHYGTLMGSRACVKMAAAAWASGFINALLHTANTFSIPLCQGNTVDQFFCEIPQILKLSCSDSYLREAGVLMFSACVAFGCFIFIVLSYVQIFTAVLRIPSEQGRHKAFSTCLPHLAVLSLFINTDLFAYLKPPSISSPALDLLVAVLYSVLPPTLNPLIYSMRNKELKDALRKRPRTGFRTHQSVSCDSGGDEWSLIYIPTAVPHIKAQCQMSILLEGNLEVPGEHRASPGTASAWHGRQSPCAAKEQMSNSSSYTEFLLPAFADVLELQLLHFSLFLGIYLAALLAMNPLIYSMRNKELKDALRKLVHWVQCQHQ